MDLKYISGREVFEKLDMKTCIGLMKDLFAALSDKKAENKLRSVLPIDSGKLMGIMPGSLPYTGTVGAKLITVFHDNYKIGKPSHQGIVALFSTEDGQPLGVCDGMAITAVRTGAVSGLATDLLAAKDADTLCLIGGGMQAVMHLKAMTGVRDIKKVNVWCPTTQESERFIASNKDRYPGIEFNSYADCDKAVADADIICTVTLSKTPVLKGEWVKKGAHINAVGACAAADRELDSPLVAESRFFCDSMVSCTNESGDYLYPLKEGLIDESHILAELGDVLTGKKSGRVSGDDITIFESLGLAREDLACAVWLLK